MNPGTLASLAAWQSFYVILGSAAAALTGLQFVVMALVSNSRQTGSMREVDAFGTPTVVHFCAVLLGSATLSAPWHRMSSAGLTLGVFGAAGIVYTLVVMRRARRTMAYKPVLEDWIWHVGFPLVAYTVTTGAAILLPQNSGPPLFAVAAMSLLLLYVGIHNAWDTVTYVAVKASKSSERSE
ncbi:MAG TPA: hypothetical protein VIE43_23170 [Thermoanaerobaculia bacterium]|jgi:hypothetical protein|nr:hypothetical protein [Thermoanaerobaculia bacterium]